MLERHDTTGVGSAPGKVRWIRLGLGYLLLVALLVGVWAQFAPQSFYTTFPGFGHTWVGVDGPYNEHLIRDVGGGYLAVATIALLALLRPQVLLVRAVALAVLVSQVPHLVYHVAHVGLLASPADMVIEIASLTLGIVVPVLLLFAVARPRGPANA